MNILAAESKYIKFSHLKTFLKQQENIKDKVVLLRDMYNEGDINYYLDKVRITLSFKNLNETEFFLEMESFLSYVNEGNSLYYHVVAGEITNKCPSQLNRKSIRKNSRLKVKIELMMETINYD